MPDGLEGLLASNAVPEKVVSGMGQAEGPVFSRLGYLLFSDTAAGRIVKWKAGETSTFRQNSNGSIGLTFDHQGRLLACERGRVTRTEKNGGITVLAGRLRAPHDLVYAIDGSIYFSAPAPAPADSAVYQITPKGEVRVVSRDCQLPHGVTLAPNQQKLYAADAGAGKIWVYDIAGDGALSHGRVFAPARSHGLKTDEKGNVWAVDDHSLAVFDAQGRRLGEIPMPEDATNCTWGDGFRNLYVTAKTSVYKIATKVNGTRTY
jgi:gluconolactonase